MSSVAIVMSCSGGSTLLPHLPQRTPRPEKSLLKRPISYLLLQSGSGRGRPDLFRPDPLLACPYTRLFEAQQRNAATRRSDTQCFRRDRQKSGNAAVEVHGGSLAAVAEAPDDQPLIVAIRDEASPRSVDGQAANTGGVAAQHEAAPATND